MNILIPLVLLHAGVGLLQRKRESLLQRKIAMSNSTFITVSISILFKAVIRSFQFVPMDHFTVVCFVTWYMNESEAGFDLVLILNSLLFVFHFRLISMATSLT